jgi:hypothetical protein
MLLLLSIEFRLTSRIVYAGKELTTLAGVVDPDHQQKLRLLQKDTGRSLSGDPMEAFFSALLSNFADK